MPCPAGAEVSADSNGNPIKIESRGLIIPTHLGNPHLHMGLEKDMAEVQTGRKTIPGLLGAIPEPGVRRNQLEVLPLSVEASLPRRHRMKEQSPPSSMAINHSSSLR